MARRNRDIAKSQTSTIGRVAQRVASKGDTRNGRGHTEHLAELGGRLYPHARTLSWISIGLALVLSCFWVLKGDADTVAWRATVAGFIIAVISGIVTVAFRIEDRKLLASSAERNAQAVAIRLPNAVPSEVARSVRPSDLLLAERRVTPWRGRRAEMMQLQDWCIAESSPRFFILSGAPLSGKTRLYLEFGRTNLGPGWRISKLRSGRERGAFALLDSLPVRHVVVVEMDEAGRDLTEFVSDVAQSSDNSRWRIILVCRSPIRIRALGAQLEQAVLSQAQALTSGTMRNIGDANDRIRWRAEATASFQNALGSHGDESARDSTKEMAGEEPFGLLVARALVDLFGLARVGDVFSALAEQELLKWPIFPIRDGDRGVPGESLARRCFAFIWLLGANASDDVREAVRPLVDPSQFNQISSYMVELYRGTEERSIVLPMIEISARIAVPELLLNCEQTIRTVAELQVPRRSRPQQC